MNILSLIQSQLSPQAIGQISNTVGESPENTKSALGTAVPAVLGSLIGKANASPDGATQIFNTLQQHQGSWMDSISSTLSSGAQAQGGTGSLLNSILGSRLGPVAEFISSHCGIKSSSATSLMGMAAPLVMGTLHKQVSSGNLGAAGLGQLLNSQADHLKEVMPSGLANTLGIGGLLGGTHDAARVPADGARPTYASPRGVPVSPMAARRASNPLAWAVPLIIAAAIAVWALSRHASRTSAVGGTEDYTQTQAGHGVGTADLSNLNLPPGSTADKMAKAVSSGNWNQQFDLSNLKFDSSGHLDESAHTELQQIGSVLKAVPNAKVSITGYGATQDEGMAKANSIKSRLTSAGVSAERMETRGDTGAGAPSVRLMK